MTPTCKVTGTAQRDRVARSGALVHRRSLGGNSSFHRSMSQFGCSASGMGEEFQRVRVRRKPVGISARSLQNVTIQILLVEARAISSKTSRTVTPLNRKVIVGSSGFIPRLPAIPVRDIWLGGETLVLTISLSFRSAISTCI